MVYKVIPTLRFQKEAKKLIKRYASLKQELAELEKSLQQYPSQGIPLGSNTFKIRLSIKSKGKGKSGGGRIITYVIIEDFEIYLLSIYDKSEIASVDDKTLKSIVHEIKKTKKNPS